MKHLLTFTLIFSSLIASIRAATLQLNSGEILIGTLESETEMHYQFRSKALGVLTIQKSIGTLQPDETPEVKTNPSPPPHVQTDLTSEPAPNSTFYNLLQSISPFKHWKSRITASYMWNKDEVSNHDWVVGFKSKRDWNDFKLNLNIRYDYRTTEIPGSVAATTRNRFLSSFKIAHKINQHFDWRSTTGYQFDYVKDISHEFSEDLGVVWHLIRNDRFTFWVEPAYGARYRQTSIDRGSWENLLKFNEHMEVKLTRSVKLWQEAGMEWNSSNFSRSAYHFQLGIEDKLTDAFGISAIYENEFDYELDLGINRMGSSVRLELFYDF